MRCRGSFSKARKTGKSIELAAPAAAQSELSRISFLFQIFQEKPARYTYRK
jgi:hypothetical protein